MSDTEESSQMTKEERLEAAKKKYEALKEKNKKKKKKSKNAKKTEATEGEAETEVGAEGGEEKSGTPEISGAEDKDKDTEVVGEQEVIKDKETEEVPSSKDVTEAEVEGKEEEEDKVEVGSEANEEVVQGVSKEEVEVAEQPPKDDGAKEESKEEEAKESEAPAAEAPSTTWIGDSEETGKSWLDEIQEKDQPEPVAQDTTTPIATTTTTDTVDSLKHTITVQAQEIKELKEENTDLRMNKFELLEKIESLELTVKRLNGKLNMKNVDQAVYQSDYNSDLSLSPPLASTTTTTNQITTNNPMMNNFVKTPSFQNFQNDLDHNNYSSTSGTDLRDRFANWKDWQVDMRNWRSIVAGPVVEI